MERTKVDYRVKTFLGEWDIGGGVSIEHKNNGYFLHPIDRFRPELLFFYFLILIGVPGIGVFTSPGLYALADAFRGSGDLMTVFSSHLRFTAVSMVYCIFFIAYPVWAIAFRAKRAIFFNTQERIVVFGRFWRYSPRFRRHAIPFERIREIEVLHTQQVYLGGDPEFQGRPRATKKSVFLSVITIEDEPFYIIRLPDGLHQFNGMDTVANGCDIPLVHETFPHQ